MQYKTRIEWRRNEVPFNAKTYDRTHYIHFNGGFSIEASSAPEFAGDANLPNPEEFFTASLSSCFMLTFLYLAAMKGLVIDEYKVEAIGTLSKNAEGKMAMTEVILKPSIFFGENKAPDQTTLDELFSKAHDACFITSSVKTKVTIDAKSMMTTS